jgi:hypothetical protein
MIAELSASSLCPHPNEVDRLRIEKFLGERERYKYVSPKILPVEEGYLVRSPCCSRTVDPQGGEIDIAKIEYQSGDFWRLYRKDDDRQCWCAHSEFHNLATLLALLVADPKREFWR